MVLHDFIYKWDGKSRDGKPPVAWWPGTYHVRIVKLAQDSDKIRYLVTFAVILKNMGTKPGMSTSLKNYIYNFAKKVSDQYEIDMEKTMWIEVEDDALMVTRLYPVFTALSPADYSVSWRHAMPNELELIKPYLDGM